MLSSILDSFVKKSPISVMAHGMIERVLNPDQLDQWFDATANEPYTMFMGADVIENDLSGFYIADEISGTYRAMMIAIPDEHWTVFQKMETSELVTALKELSENVKMSAFRKHPRVPKKPQPKRKSCKKSPHVSTAIIIADRKK